MSLDPALRREFEARLHDSSHRSFPSIRDRQRFRAWLVTPNSSHQMHIRFGVEVPIPVAGLNDTGKSGPVEYRSLGTNIDCSNVRDLSGGRYQFEINLQNSAALPGAEVDGKESRPLFRRFDTSFTAELRDGQSMQTIASTNPVTGEVIKIDVTLNVVR